MNITVCCPEGAEETLGDFVLFDVMEEALK